jgi:tRNA A37 N6-isopentenylltransferase MiaA
MAEAAPVVALCGATALGKTEVALRLAERLGAEIVVADSMQVYAGLALVTNQPDACQRVRVPQHLVGFVAPQVEFTVAEQVGIALQKAGIRPDEKFSIRRFTVTRYREGGGSGDLPDESGEVDA